VLFALYRPLNERILPRTPPKFIKMSASTPPLDFDHLLGQEVPTKHKKAIQQLHWVGKLSIPQLEERYKLRYSTIRRILAYNALEQAQPGRTRRPQKLKDSKVNKIIEYYSENWEQRIIDYNALVIELKLDCTISTLQKQLHQRGYFRCTICQKPYFTSAQVISRFL